MPVTPELAALAENGITGDLTDELDLLSAVYDYNVAGGGIGPGQSDTLMVQIRGRGKFISLAGMLICSNDAFVATETGYSAGKFGFLNVLDAQRALFDAHSLLLDRREYYALALAKLERLTGDLPAGIGHAEPSDASEYKYGRR
jgi:hypothetical protein